MSESEFDPEASTVNNASVMTAPIEPKPKGRRGRPRKGTQSESESDTADASTIKRGVVDPSVIVASANDTTVMGGGKQLSLLLPPQTPQNKRRADLDDTILKENAEPNLTIQGSRMRERLEAILQEYDIEVETRVMSMNAEAEKLCHQLRSAFNVELMKIPKKWRTMTMREFQELHKCDWSLLTSRSIGQANMTQMVAPTPMKLPPPSAAKITIKLDDGTELDGTQHDTAMRLNPKAREEAKKRLMDLQGQLNALMTQLK